MSQLKAQVDKILSNVSSKYNPKGMICEQFLPLIQVPQNTGLLAGYGDSHLRIENSLKGGKSKYRRVETVSYTTQTYLIRGHGLEALVTKEDKRNYDDPFDAEKDETTGLTTSLFLEKEKVLADAVTSTSIMTQNETLSGNAQFSDYTNSDPLKKFKSAYSTVRSACGAIIDTAAMDYDVFQQLRYHPQLLDALGYKFDRPGGLGADELAKALGLRRILVADVMYNSAQEGQTSVKSPVWGKHIVLAVLPEKAEKEQISLGYRLQISGSQPRKVYKWTENNPPESTAILVEDEYEHLISNASAGFLFKNAIA